MVHRVVVVRHAHRQDTERPDWAYSSAEPWNPPLSSRGVQEAAGTAEAIKNALQKLDESSQNIRIVSSPFLRCLQSVAPVAEQLNVSVCLANVFGEWMQPDYFTRGAPPNDNHASINATGLAWIIRNRPATAKLLDFTVDATRWGEAGHYGEAWVEMHLRVCQGLERILADEAFCAGVDTLVLVTHGSVCNSLLAALRHTPQVEQIALASFAIEPVSGITITTETLKNGHGPGGSRTGCSLQATCLHSSHGGRLST